MKGDSDLDKYLILENTKNFVASFDGITNYHLEYKKTNQNVNWHVRPQLIIRLWVKKDIFNSKNVLLKLSEEDTFDMAVEKICKGNVIPIYDIYFV